MSLTVRSYSVVLPTLVCLMLTACGDSPVAPTASDMTGTWVGTGAYPNAPFQLILTQTGSTLRGEYSDRLDRSPSVTGTFANPGFSISVNFGDAGLTITGTITDARHAQGTMATPSLGNQVFPFTMTR